MNPLNLLQAEESLCVEKAYLIDPITQALDDRLDWLGDREPESEGEVHDNWEDKYSELESITEAYHDCLDTVEGYGDVKDIEDEEEKEAAIKDINEAISDVKGLLANYQKTYGGISRLSI